MRYLRSVLTAFFAVGCLALFSTASFADNGPEAASKGESGEKTVKGFAANIEQDTLDNGKFRKVLYTGKYSQLVLMSLLPKEEIGTETHEGTDQFFRFEKGRAKVIINSAEYNVADGSAVVIPAGATHNIINTSDSEELKLYTIYSPPHHKDGIVRGTKEEAAANSQEFDGKTTE